MTSEQETKRLAREASRLDKECPPAIYVALHCGCIATYGEHPTQGRANLKYIRSDLAKQREAELVELLRRARWALHVWESQDYDVQSRLSLQNEAADLRCEIASRLESYKAEGREGS